MDITPKTIIRVTNGEEVYYRCFTGNGIYFEVLWIGPTVLLMLEGKMTDLGLITLSQLESRLEKLGIVCRFDEARIISDSLKSEKYDLVVFRSPVEIADVKYTFGSVQVLPKWITAKLVSKGYIIIV